MAELPSTRPYCWNYREDSGDSWASGDRLFPAGDHEAFGHGFHNLLVDLVDAQVAFDQDDSFRFTGGDRAILMPDTAVEGVLLRFEAVFVLTGLGRDTIVAAAGSLERARATDAGCGRPERGGSLGHPPATGGMRATSSPAFTTSLAEA